MNERYYYGIMPMAEKEVYKTIYLGIIKRCSQIIIESFVLVEQIQETYLKVLYDNPLFYFVNQTVIRMAGQLGCYILMPEYFILPKKLLA